MQFLSGISKKSVECTVSILISYRSLNINREKLSDFYISDFVFFIIAILSCELISHWGFHLNFPDDY